ncbi:hypothetical protein J2X07_002559 [Fictibacillus barbaricus]|uniref:RNA polymerase sigma-70 domain-containing protein n=1 Tax=Fictibacillus barbaricus TaxID=182136 RepID=A0ABU1U2A0_9BACL|nr:hypothetical protein [Fictibacillus barbaricus]
MSLVGVLVYFFKEVMLFVSYVKNNAFPQPLSENEEKQYLKDIANGDEHARGLLIEHNLRLVAHNVKKFENTGEDTEDLISIGTIGLIKAIESYSRGKGTKLATYAARCIENEILMSLVVHDLCKRKNKDLCLLYNKTTLTNFVFKLLHIKLFNKWARLWNMMISLSIRRIEGITKSS